MLSYLLYYVLAIYLTHEKKFYPYNSIQIFRIFLRRPIDIPIYPLVRINDKIKKVFVLIIWSHLEFLLNISTCLRMSFIKTVFK